MSDTEQKAHSRRYLSQAAGSEFLRVSLVLPYRSSPTVPPCGRSMRWR